MNSLSSLRIMNGNSCWSVCLLLNLCSKHSTDRILQYAYLIMIQNLHIQSVVVWCKQLSFKELLISFSKRFLNKAFIKLNCSNVSSASKGSYKWNGKWDIHSLLYFIWNVFKNQFTAILSCVFAYSCKLTYFSVVNLHFWNNAWATSQFVWKKLTWWRYYSTS